MRAAQVLGHRAMPLPQGSFLQTQSRPVPDRPLLPLLAPSFHPSSFWHNRKLVPKKPRTIRLRVPIFEEKRKSLWVSYPSIMSPKFAILASQDQVNFLSHGPNRNCLLVLSMPVSRLQSPKTVLCSSPSLPSEVNRSSDSTFHASRM